MNENKGSKMVLSDEYHAVIPKMEALLADLDQLQLASVAVHVDLALCRLKEILAGGQMPEVDAPSN